MSRCNYSNWHEIKDLVSIYHEDEWDNARVVVWNPVEQKEYNLIFVGSTKPGVESEEGIINFVISPTNPTRFDRFRLKFALDFTIFRVKVEGVRERIKDFWWKLWVR